ncbi:hypothetical protein Nepgr_028783 [Nepenthes gracilis]|uniref:Uncharacterized protein n=1 Tax=Nepenthes gracilis TaxID=150966 RepID=A0AAD3Y493_NEPGR|nr:hypothetical protein Nepgr_028783 [Nepenthes gracilis]
MYSLAVALLGLLDTISTGLAMDVYGPNSDIDVYGCVRLCMDVYAGGMTEMVGMRYIICTMTDTLDVATMDIGIIIRSTVHLSLAFPSILEFHELRIYRRTKQDADRFFLELDGEPIVKFSNTEIPSIFPNL